MINYNVVCIGENVNLFTKVLPHYLISSLLRFRLEIKIVRAMDGRHYHGFNKDKNVGFKVTSPPGGHSQLNLFQIDSEEKKKKVHISYSSYNENNISMPIKTKADRNSSTIVFAGPQLTTTCTPQPLSEITKPSKETTNEHNTTPSRSRNEEKLFSPRSSTKVSAPPGGRSSISLFG